VIETLPHSTTVESGMTCVLPGGYMDRHGVLHREAELIPLTGREEELLVDRPENASSGLVTHLLSRCVRRIGAVEPVTVAVARQLLIADRDYLLLKLRELSFGTRVEGTVACPWPQCGARVDVDFSTADVPLTSRPVTSTFVVELSPEAAVADAAAGTSQRTLTFRLPNGADQEALAPVLMTSAAQALTGLLERCIVPPPDEDRSQLVQRLSARARYEVEQAMQEQAPHVELDMALVCPECGRSFNAPFNVQDFLFGELRNSRDLLYRQVHYLAYHYHWGEAEIMRLPRDKRLTYIEVLAEEIEALNDAF
jgi:uncharacterized protein (UPF0212 family)